MIATIADKQVFLADLCRRYRVNRLELFGSAADGTFDPKHSDLDFLVEFELLSPAGHYEPYFGLLESLEELFERKIDLVESGAMRNPYFIAEVNASRKVVFEAFDDCHGVGQGRVGTAHHFLE